MMRDQPLASLSICLYPLLSFIFSFSNTAHPSFSYFFNLSSSFIPLCHQVPIPYPLFCHRCLHLLFSPVLYSPSHPPYTLCPHSFPPCLVFIPPLPPFFPPAGSAGIEAAFVSAVSFEGAERESLGRREEMRHGRGWTGKMK